MAMLDFFSGKHDDPTMTTGWRLGSMASRDENGMKMDHSQI